MHFVLHYNGELHANGRPLEKQRIRRHFHAQLSKIVQSIPSLKWLHTEEKPDFTDKEDHKWQEYVSVAEKEVSGFNFRAIVKKGMVCELDIKLLRPEPPGQIVTQAGDLDNRLKTLFDSLCIPPHENQIPEGDIPAENESPLFCLLEDDNLISKVTIGTDTFWEDAVSPSQVVLLIEAKVEIMHGDYHLF